MLESSACQWLLLLLPFALLLSILLCCAWEHFDISRDHSPGLSDGQIIAAVLVFVLIAAVLGRLELQTEFTSERL